MTATDGDLTVDHGFNVLPPRLVTVVDAARLLGIGRSTAYELIARGDIDVVHIGRSARVPVSSLDRFVSKLQGPGRPERSSTSANVRSGPSRSAGTRSCPPNQAVTVTPPS